MSAEVAPPRSRPLSLSYTHPDTFSSHKSYCTVTQCKGGLVLLDGGNTLLRAIGSTIFQDGHAMYGGECLLVSCVCAPGGAVGCSAVFCSDASVCIHICVHSTQTGAIFAQNGRTQLLAQESSRQANVELGDHTSVRYSSALYGGGIYIDRSSLKLSGDAHVHNNRAHEWGGGLCMDRSTLLGIGGRFSFEANAVIGYAGSDGSGVFDGVGHQIYQTSMVRAAISPCPPGTFFSGVLQVGIDHNFTGCSDVCFPGTFAVDTADRQSCASCPAGSFCPNGQPAELPEPCPAGKFNSGMGSTSAGACILCPKGFYAPKFSPRCFECQRGEYQNRQGSGSCVSCPMGWFRGDSTGALAENCSRCALGQTTAGEKAASCVGCGLGSRGDAGNPGFCVGCEPGLYTDSRGASSCQECADLRKVPNEARTACEKPSYKVAADCGDRAFLDDSDMDRNLHRCLPCPAGASCKGAVSWRGVKAKFGYWRLEVATRNASVPPPCAFGSTIADPCVLFFKWYVSRASMPAPPRALWI